MPPRSSQPAGSLRFFASATSIVGAYTITQFLPLGKWEFFFFAPGGGGFATAAQAHRADAGLIRPSPGGLPVLHRLGQRTWLMGLDSPIAGRGRSRVGPCCTRSQLASALNLPRLTQPRALGIYGASPAPYPGSLFPRRKSAQNAAGDTPDPVLPNRTPAKKPCAATETPRFGWLLVIGAVSYQPCLSAS